MSVAGEDADEIVGLVPRETLGVDAVEEEVEKEEEEEEDEKLVPSNADPSTGEMVMTREMFVGLDVGVPLDETVGEEAVEDGVRLL